MQTIPLQTIPFTKMHGLGNDFIMLKKQDITNYLDNIEQLVFAITNRYLGIGCDQLIIYSPILADHKQDKHKQQAGQVRITGVIDNALHQEDENIDCYEMLIYNADSSVASLCGNAARCLAKLLYINYGKKNIKLHTVTKKLLCSIEGEEVNINIGCVDFNACWMPALDQLKIYIDFYAPQSDVICVDVGNPHCVIFNNDLTKEEQQIIVNEINNSHLFPYGININFAVVRDNEIYLSVWERGVGLTYACASGACASFAAANKMGFVSDRTKVIFKLGYLSMYYQQNNIIMQGAATITARGEFIYA